jgi:hypothetical protein
MQEAIKHQLGGILRLVGNLFESRSGALKYTRALQLFHVVLMKTQQELEDVYFHYILKPAVRHEVNKQNLVLPCVYVCSALILSSSQI